jgi:hypothetical protein
MTRDFTPLPALASIPPPGICPVSSRPCTCWGKKADGTLVIPPPCPHTTIAWRTAADGEGMPHTFPMDDLRPHLPSDCWCRPEELEGIIVHNALDRREFYELGKLRLS